MERGGVRETLQHPPSDMTPGVCSEPYRPPEVWASAGYDLRIDVWPAGVIAAELYCGDCWWIKEWKVSMRQLSVWLSEPPRGADPSVELRALADCLANQRPSFMHEGCQRFAPPYLNWVCEIGHLRPRGSNLSGRVRYLSGAAHAARRGFLIDSTARNGEDGVRSHPWGPLCNRVLVVHPT